MTNVTLFSQIIAKLDRSKFKKIVKDRQTAKHNKAFDSWSHLISILFCYFAISHLVNLCKTLANGLRSATGNLNHLEINRIPSKSSVGYQNKTGVISFSKSIILLYYKV